MRFTMVALALLLTSASARAQPAADALVDPEIYEVRLRDLERRIEELKERIWSRPARGLPLPSTGTLDLQVDARLGGWRLETIDARLDGRPLERAGAGGAWLAAALPGTRTLTVDVRLRGDVGPLFPYVRGYSVVLRDQIAVTISTMESTALRLVVDEDPDPTVPFERRPRMRLEPGAAP